MRGDRQILGLLVIVWVGMATTGSAAAAEIEVAPTGGDYSTIQAAVDAADPGDVIRIHPGTYHEAVVIETADLTLEGTDPLAPPEIDGADPAFAPSWSHVSGQVYKTPYVFPFPHTTCEDLTDGRKGDPLLTLYEDGVWLRGWQGGEWSEVSCPYSTVEDLDASDELDAPSGRTLRVPGRFFYDEANRELYVWPSHEGDPTSHRFEIPVLKNLVSIRAANATLRNLVLKHAFYFAVSIDAAGDGATVEDCFIVSTGPWGLSAANARDLTIRRNFIQNLGFYERQDYISVRFNRIKSALVSVSGYASAADCQIYENVVSGAYGISARGQGCEVHDNIVSRSQSLLIMSQVESVIPDPSYRHDMRIYRNILHDADFSAFSNYNTLELGENLYYGDIYFYRNLIYAVRFLSKEGCEECPCDDTPDTFVYNNTFSLGKQIAQHPYNYPVMGSTVYRNNLFHLRYTYMEMYWGFSDDAADPAERGWLYYPFVNGPDSDYNLFWRDDANAWPQIARFRNADDPDHSYAEGEFDLMQSETGLDPHSQEADPLFVDAEIPAASVFAQQYDTLSTRPYTEVIARGFESLFRAAFDALMARFDVAPESPAVNGGVALPGEWPDTVAVADGQPDIGAIEHLGEDGVPPVRRSGSPSGALAPGTTSATLSLETDETATCRYAAEAGVAYAAMTETFAVTGGTAHETEVSGLEEGESYTFYIRCEDAAGNANPDDFEVTFTVGSVQARTLTAQFTDELIAIDGVLSEPAWAQTAQSLFANTSRSDNQVTARGLWDADGLTLSFEVVDATVEQAGARVWDEDAVDVYLDSQLDRATSMQPDDYQYAISVAGQVFDARGTGAGSCNDAKDPEWEGSATGAGAPTVDGFVLEVRIPWADMAFTPASEAELGLLLANNDVDGSEVAQFDWGGVIETACFAQPSLWGTLRLAGEPETCTGGLVDCDGVCVDLDTDPAHCGGCDQACASGAECVLGTCQSNCADGTTECDGVCVDLSSDRLHCGACRYVCGGDAECVSGGCQLNCADDEVERDGRCVSPDVETSGCGCGSARRPDLVALLTLLVVAVGRLRRASRQQDRAANWRRLEAL